MGFLRVVAYIIIFYYIFKFIGRLILPYLLKKGIQRMQEQQYGNYQQTEPQSEPGKVTITKNKTTSHSSASKDGEYVDFEEVK